MSLKDTVTVVGLGKIGLPLAVQFARKGFSVFGIDINENVIDLINNGREPFPGERNLKGYLSEVVRHGKLLASTNTEEAVSRSSTVIVVVPLYVDEFGIPDFRSIDKATELIGKGLQKGTLVSYETTLPIGTTRERFTPTLAKVSGLQPKEGFHVVFSPERVLTGRVFEDLKRYPKLVGGIDPISEKRGVDFYSRALDFDIREDLYSPNGVWSMGSSEAAEFAKLAETTYRDVNIALANQFALYAEQKGVDINKVIRASNSQPYSHIHKPGIAVGGHCIPIYPQMYLWNDPSATVVKSAREANEKMPSKVIDRLQEIHGTLSGQHIAVLGISYRGGVKEAAFSGVFPIVGKLKELGAQVTVHDPLYNDAEISAIGFDPYHFGDKVDAVVLQADHQEYSALSPSDLPGVRTVMDGRGILTNKNWEGVYIHIIGQSEVKS